MNVKKFIESGILEEYCLGLLGNEEQAFVIQMSLLYPEVKEELGRVELFMERFALANAIESLNPNLKNKILSSLDGDAALLDLANLPLIDKNTNYLQWLNALKHLIPAEPAGDMIFRPLRQDPQIVQTLVISKVNVPEETHNDILETLLILQGECECTIDGNVFKAGAGSVVEIPLHLEHDIRILTPYVVAILQHVAI